MESDSQTLIGRALRGDRAALGDLLVQHLPGLRAYVRLHMGELLREKASCSDLVQSVCREILKDLGDFEYRSEGAFKLWLYSHALHKIRNRDRFYRAERRAPGKEHRFAGDTSAQGDDELVAVYATLCTPSRQAIARESIQQIERAVAKLPAHYREAIVLARLVGLSNREIGERLKKSEGAVRILLHRALARLTVLMGEAGDGAAAPGA